MPDSYVIDQIKHVSNTEVVRRLLIKYFIDKGFTESFDRHMYPALIQDITQIIPSLTNKIEIVPHAHEIDTAMGKAVLGWNMFVLGNQRMFLGETYHNSLHDLARQIRSGMIRNQDQSQAANSRRQTTPRRVITFVTRVLSDHRAGYVDLSPSDVARRVDEPFARLSMSGMPQQLSIRN